MLMLSTIFMFPIFSYDTYWSETTSFDTAIVMLHNRLIFDNFEVDS